MVDEVRSTQNGSRTKNINLIINDIQKENEQEMERIHSILNKNKQKIRGQMKSDYQQEMQNVELQELELERSQQMSSDKKVQKMKLIKQLKIGRGIDSGGSDTESEGDEDLDQISLNTVKDLYENSGDGIIEGEGFVKHKKKRKVSQENEDMDLSEIEKNLEHGVD